jgi:hypothetical protein
MEFDENDITIMESLTKEEAAAYIKFLQSEIRRHARDMIEIEEKIKEVERRFQI